MPSSVIPAQQTKLHSGKRPLAEQLVILFVCLFRYTVGWQRLFTVPSIINYNRGTLSHNLLFWSWFCRAFLKTRIRTKTDILERNVEQASGTKAKIRLLTVSGVLTSGYVTQRSAEGQSPNKHEPIFSIWYQINATMWDVHHLCLMHWRSMASCGTLHHL